MKVELCVLKRGDLKLEIISETDAEYWLLTRAWELQGYPRGNGKTKTPDGMATGFYIPLCALVKNWAPESSEKPAETAANSEAQE